MDHGDSMYQFADEQFNEQPTDQLGTDECGPIPFADGVTGGIAGGITDSISGGMMGGMTGTEDAVLEEHASEVRSLGEFSIDLHGKSHPDALYRAAGGETRVHAGTVFGCSCCGRSVGRVLRVRATVRSAWVAMCAMCAASTLDRNPEAMIGGVVRASRRRRGRVGQAGPTGNGNRAAG